MAEDTTSSTPEKKTSTRNQFPRIALSKVLVLAKQIYELGEGDPVPRLVVFDRLGKSPDSGTSRMLVTTSNAYGLTTGSYQAERLGITDRGRSIVEATDQGVVRSYAVKALLDNNLFTLFYEKYQNKGIPQEAVAVDYLKRAGNLSEADAKSAYQVFIANLNDFGFIKEMSGRMTVVSQDLMDVKVLDQNSADVMPPTLGVKASGSESGGESNGNGAGTGDLPQALVPQFNFNIQVQLPENATAETYDAIFKSMAEHLLKTSRR
jgi:hypothetical protein